MVPDLFLCFLFLFLQWDCGGNDCVRPNADG